MNPYSRKHLRRGGFLSAVICLSLVVTLLSPAAFAWQQAATSGSSGAAAPARKAAATLTASEQKAAARVKLETIREVTTELSSPKFEGRGTGQPGADRAAQYLADRFAKLGLKPAGENGTYLQPIKFKSAQLLSETSVKVGDTSLQHATDYVVLPPYSSESVDVSGGLVFAGFGVVSPELNRDDLAGLDLKNKVVIILSGQPAGVDATAWKKATAPQARAMSIFGRGAVAIIVGNAGSAAQPYATIANYLSRRRVSLASQPAPPFKIPPVLLTSDAAMEKVFAGSEMTYAQTLEKAKTGATVSRDLGKTATLALRFKLGETTSNNVAGVLEGSDPKLKEEAVVFTAHYDAYGIESDGRIFPGAADNALGVGTITSIAEAITKAFPKPSSRPRRSIIFLAVTGEEYGLFGAEHWVAHPTWPLDKVAADINFDGIGTEIYGPVKRVVGFGAEHSDLGDIFEDVSAATGNIVSPDPMPEENAFTRSDHYSFVKKGVPALMLLGAPAGDEAMWIARARKWLETDYHSPSDTVKPDWDWTGPQTLGQLGMIIGLRVANADAMPTWRATSPFNKPRKLPTN
ncbi:MAG TPA: M28 family peptidase [Pyrinomonadaceae bacterium]|nr:M28 family peptidase [Pyrinomonadaceae bacterium]